jgi:hypothetical protein
MIEFKWDAHLATSWPRSSTYGSWASGLGAESLICIFETGPFAHGQTFHTTFVQQFDRLPPVHRLATPPQAKVVVGACHCVTLILAPASSSITQHYGYVGIGRVLECPYVLAS